MNARSKKLKCKLFHLPNLLKVTMSNNVEALIETPESVRNDAFVEVRYEDSIPNNVNLDDDKQLQRALEEWHPNYLDW